MSTSRTILKLVQGALPRLRLCRNKLVLPPTDHFVRGFMLERTPYKGQFYLWRLVMPLFRMSIDYSRRVPRGATIDLTRDAPDQSAVELARIISSNVDYLESIQSPRDFLDHISWMIGNDSPFVLFDLAVTYFLVGRYHEAVLALWEASVEAERRIARFEEIGGSAHLNVAKLTQLHRAAVAFAAAIKSDPNEATEIVRDWERRNIDHFELAETVDATPTPSARSVERDRATHVPPPPQPPDRNPRRGRKAARTSA